MGSLRHTFLTKQDKKRSQKILLMMNTFFIDAFSRVFLLKSLKSTKGFLYHSCLHTVTVPLFFSAKLFVS